jgi:hypothetical protein
MIIPARVCSKPGLENDVNCANRYAIETFHETGLMIIFMSVSIWIYNTFFVDDNKAGKYQ